MTFSPTQTELLSAEIDSALVKLNQDGNLFIEGYVAIEQANRIFGFDAWSYRILRIDRETAENNQILYFADVEVTVTTPDGVTITRQDTGTQPVGNKAGNSSAKGLETARKGAVTDALKRALRSFGNQFGNSLYDKESTANAKMKRGGGGKAASAAKPATSAPRSAPKTDDEPPIPCEGFNGPCTGQIVASDSKTEAGKRLQPRQIVELTRPSFDGKALCKRCMKAYMDAKKAAA